jgi:prepilin-type N-terminal cleavage/methylation domain-containing protein
MTPFTRDSGFTLIETIVATAIVATALAALAHLFALGAAQTLHNRYALSALNAAQGKLRQLQAATWSYSGAAPELVASPAGALLEDVDGYVDYLDTNARIVASSAQGSASYVRRWSIQSLMGGDPDTLVLHVCVSPRTSGDRTSAVCVASIRTRRP